MDYKWVVLILCFCMEFVCMGFCSSNGGLYTKAITEALDIKRSVYALSTSIRYGTQVLLALSFGTVTGRLGIKKTACIGMACLALSTLTRAAATHVVHIYLGSILWGVGVVFSGGTMAGTIVRRWFKQDVGRYTGIVMSANGLGGALAAQIISPLINSGEVFGYRKAYLLASVMALAMGAVVVAFLRERPADGAEDIPAKKKAKGPMWVGIPYETAKKKPYFYFAAALIFVTGLCTHGVGNVTLVYLADVGMKPGFVAAAATVSSLCLTAGKLFIGIFYDKKGLRVTLLVCQAAAIGSFLCNALLHNTALGMVMAITATVLECFALTMETVMIPLLANDLFGTASYEKVLGVFMAMNSLGLCLGSPLGDLCFDLFGTYRPCFWLFAGVLAVVVVCYQLVIGAAYRDKKAVCESIA